MQESKEEVWSAALGALLHLTVKAGKPDRAAMQSLPPRVLAALLRCCIRFHWCASACWATAGIANGLPALSHDHRDSQSNASIKLGLQERVCELHWTAWPAALRIACVYRSEQTHCHLVRMTANLLYAPVAGSNGDKHADSTHLPT